MEAVPSLDLSAIPTAQRAAIQALMDEVAALAKNTRRKQRLIAGLDHALHGKRSEKLTENKRPPAFEDLSIAPAEVEAEKEIRTAKGGDGATRPAPRP